MGVVCGWVIAAYWTVGALCFGNCMLHTSASVGSVIYSPRAEGYMQMVRKAIACAFGSMHLPAERVWHVARIASGQPEYLVSGVLTNPRKKFFLQPCPFAMAKQRVGPEEVQHASRIADSACPLQH